MLILIFTLIITILLMREIIGLTIQNFTAKTRIFAPKFQRSMLIALVKMYLTDTFLIE